MIKRLIAALFFLCAVASATTVPNTSPYQSFLNPNTGGLPCAGCSIYSYQAGSTTPLATYTDSTGGSQNTNPIVLDTGGGAQIWLGANCYKLILKDTGGSTIWTADNVCPVIAQGAPLSVTSLTTTQLNLTYTPAPGSTLQAVINAASANSAISLSCGTYTVSAGLTMSSNNVRLAGQTRDCTFINFTSNTGLTVSGSGVEIEGITFEGATLHSVSATSAATGFRFHDNTVTQGGAVAGSIPSGLWIQANLNDFVVERNNFTGNGPASFSSGNATGYTILISGQASGMARNGRIRNNRIWANNSAISIAAFDCSGSSTDSGCQITDNVINQGNVYDGTEGSGYGIMLYEEGYALTTTALSRTSNVVTVVVTTQPAGEPWTIGQTILASAYGFGGSGTSFNGIFTLTGASGTGPYTLTWAQTAPDDSVTGGALNGATSNVLQHSTISGNAITNCAGACFYGQGLSDIVFTSNEISNSDLTIVPSSLLHAGVSFNGLWHGVISGNSSDGATHSSAFYLAHAYGVTFSGNVGVNAVKDGLRLGDSYDLSVTGNYFAANTNGQIVGESTTTINCFHCGFTGNTLYLTPSSDGYHFGGLDQYDNVTGGECHGPSTGVANACFFATSTTADIGITGFEADCYADGGTVKAVNYGLRSAGTRITMKSNPKIVGCAIDGILDAGTNDDIEENTITASLTGIVASASTGVTILNNHLAGNSTALTTAGATTPVVSANIVTIGTLPVYNGSAIQVAGNTVLSTTQTGIQGNGVNVATASGAFTFHHLRQTDSGGAEADANLNAVQVPGLVIDCVAAATCTNSIPTNPWFTVGGIPLVGGTITITGISPAYTSNTSYRCYSWDLTTPANATTCTRVSGSSITITGTGTDSVTYLLIGN